MSDAPEAVLSTFIVYPGDTLILGFARPLSPESLDRIVDRARHQLPGLNVVVVDQLTHLAVYRADRQPVPEGDTT